MNQLSMTSIGKVKETLNIFLCSADLELVAAASSQEIEILCDRPDLWQVHQDQTGSTARETGTPLALALAEAEREGKSGHSYSFSSGWRNGELYINNKKIDLSYRPRLVIRVPPGLVCRIQIKNDYIGHSSIDADLAGRLEARLSARATMQIVDQTQLQEAVLKASMGASISTGKLTASGLVKLKADMSGSRIDTAQINADSIQARAEMGAVISSNERDWLSQGEVMLKADSAGSYIQVGSVTGLSLNAGSTMGGVLSGKNLQFQGDINCKADSSASTVRFALVKGSCVVLKADMGGDIELAQCDAVSLQAKADMSGNITVRKGSATSGKAKADMSGRVSLKGQFQSLQVKQDMGGTVTVKE